MSATRAKLIQVAFEQFGRRGFHGVGLDRIIDDAGVSKQTFYNHFECKDDLVLAVLAHRHETESKVFGDLITSHGGRSARGQLYALFDALDAWMSQPDWRGCIFMTAAAEFPLQSDPAHQAAAEHNRLLQEHLQSLATLARASDPEGLALELAVLISGAIAYRHATGRQEVVHAARTISKMLLDRAVPTEPATASNEP